MSTALVVSRRGFLQRLAATAAAVALAPLANLLPAPTTLAFHPLAFQVSWDPVAIRFDVLMGVAWVRPELVCRIVSDDELINATVVRSELLIEAADA